MDIWQILEIEPTSDTKSIKRAYAKKLKITRPDENPKGFQDLHWAYKTALQHAEWMAQQETNNDPDEENNYEQSDINSYTEESIQESVQEPVSEQQHTPDQDEKLTLDHTIYITQPATEIYQTETTESCLQADNQIETGKLVTDSVESSLDNNIQQQEIIVNPYQQEGERLLGVTKLLLASNGEQAKAECWSFIIESSLILEDHFNWRLGLEVLQLIREHNLGHAAQVNKIVGQEVMTYLDSIFNWNANRQQILRALGDEYQTWLDMIHDSQQADDNWQDKIRGGRKLTLANQDKNSDQELPENSIIAPPFRRFMAWLIDWVFIFFVFMLLNEDSPDISPLFASVVFPLLYFVFFESSQLQGTIGKRILGLKVVRFNLEPMKVTHSILRTICFLIYQTLLIAVVAGISIGVPFATFIIIGIYAYSFSKDPTLFYDRITKTSVIQTSK